MRRSTSVALVVALIASLLLSLGGTRPADAATHSFTASCTTTSTSTVSIAPGDTLTIDPANCPNGRQDFASPQLTCVLPPNNPTALPSMGWGSLQPAGCQISFSTTTIGTYQVRLRISSTQVQTIVIKVEASLLPFVTTVAPTIAGTAEVGQTLTASTSDWDPVATMGYQWYAGGTAISGATASTFQVTTAQVGKTITVKATGTKDGYTSATLESSPTVTVPALPFATTTDPTIIGDAIVGRTLTASVIGWSPTPTSIAYTWFADGNEIVGATGSSYLIDVVDRGTRISVRITASALSYLTTEATSASTTAVALPTGLTLTYVANATGTTGAVPVDPATHTMLDSITVAAPGSLARDGYDFDGWNTRADGLGTRYDAESTLTFGSESVSLHAQWAPRTYTISFSVNGSSTGQQVTFITGGDATLPNAPVPGQADSGRRFSGWFIDPEMTTTAAAAGAPFTPGVMSDLTLYGTWIDYTVEFSAVLSPLICLVNGVGFRWGESIDLPSEPTGCESMRIDGWYLDAAKTMRIGGPGDRYTPVGTPRDLVLHAKTTARYVTWWKTTSNSSDNIGTWHAIGETVVLRTPPQYANKQFVWWRNNNAAILSAGDHAVTADFVQSEVGAVTMEAMYRSWLRFDLAGGTGGPADVAVIATSQESPYTGFGAETPTRAGYVFDGWFDPDGIERENALNVGGDITLTARWTPNVNVVVYDSQGGSPVADGSFLTGGTLTVAAAPTRSGYVFDGWYDAPVGGSRRSGTYSPAETAGFTLHARWTVASLEMSLDLSIDVGARIEDASVVATARGLADSAPYELVLRSTPRVLERGNAVGGVIEIEVDLPDDLEPGWHSLTLTSIASDGSEVMSVVHFEVSAAGVLLEVTTTPPPSAEVDAGAERQRDAALSRPTVLPMTGASAGPFSSVGAVLIALGMGLHAIARHRRSRAA